MRLVDVFLTNNKQHTTKTTPTEILGFQVDCLMNVGSKKCAKRDPKWHQNGTQNGPKSKTKTKTKTRHSLRSSWGALRAILGRSWATPISKIVLSPRVALVLVKMHIFEKIRPQEATWAELRPTWAPKRGAKWSQRGR